MKFKSKLGIAALEELNEAEVNTEGTENPTDGEDTTVADAVKPVETTTDAVTTDAPATDAVVTDDTTTATDTTVTDAAAGTDVVTDTTVTDTSTDTTAATVDPDAATADADAAAATAQVDATSDPIENTDDDDTADSEIVEEEMNAVDKIEDKSADVTEDVEKLEAATESLEGVVAALESAIERGGLDVIGASLVRNNLNTVTKSLRVQSLLIPALEDMETPSAKIEAAGNTKDQIVAFIKRIIAAIKSAFVRFGEWITETYKRLTNAFVAIERRAEKLAERLKTSKMVDGKIENKGLAKKLTVNGKPVEDLKNFLASTTAVTKYLNDPATYKDYLAAIDECEQLIKNPEKTEEITGKISELLGRWSSEMEKHALDITKAVRGAAPSNASKTVTNNLKYFVVPLLNNQGLAVSVPDSAAGIRGMSATIIEAPTGPSTTSVESLSSADAASICELVAALAKQTRESGESNRGGVKELMAEIKKRNDTISAMAQSLGDAAMKSEGMGDTGRKVIMFINSVLMGTPKLPVHAINRTLPRNLGFALDYVAASMGGTVEVAKGTDVAVA